MDPALTEKALRIQEPMLLSHIHLFISKLNGMSSSSHEGAIVDIMRWLSFVFFETIGDLGFGEPFGYMEFREPSVVLYDLHVSQSSNVSNQSEVLSISRLTHEFCCTQECGQEENGALENVGRQDQPSLEP
jgi:hypothetical protein